MQQGGSGSTKCPSCDEAKKEEAALSQIVMENNKKNALKTPVPQIIPSITTVWSPPAESAEEKTVPTQEHAWYYLGPA